MRMASVWRAALALSLIAPALLAQDAPPVAGETDQAIVLPDDAETRQIVALLEAGFGPDLADLRDAQKRVAALRRNPRHDPRADYAYGLVLLNHFKPREAKAAFAAAVDASQLAYLPAWMAHIRIHLLRRNYYQGLELLDQLAPLLADDSTKWSDPQAPVQGAHWVGRVIGACQLAKVKVNDGPDPTRLDAAFQSLFEGDLNAAYQLGRDSIQQEYENLSGEFDRTQLHVERMQKDRQKRRQKKIDRKRQTVKEEAQTVERTTVEWKAWLDEELARIDNELTNLKQDYETLEKTDTDIANAMVRLAGERVAAQVAERAGYQQRRRNNFVPLSLRIEQRIVEYQKQRNKLASEAASINEQARILVSQRESATREYQTATGQLTKDASETQKWKQAFQKAAEKNKAAASKSARSLRARKQRLTRLATYLDFDTKDAKRALLEELGQTP